MLSDNATQITHEQGAAMLDKWLNNNRDASIPYEQFWYAWNDGECDWYDVIDNRGGEFFMESFQNIEAAHAWLRDVDVDVCYEIERLINDSCEW